jgi:benzil reductase ((S)-benzoin forming)
MTANGNTHTVAILTGASRGLGQALALGLLAPDTQLITVARTHNAALAEHAHNAGMRLQQIQTDLANPAATERIAEQIIAELPTTAQRYLLINNAGMVEPIAQADHLDSPSAITAAFSLNVSSVMLLTSAFLKAVKPLQADVRIMNISSGAGRNPMPGWGVYCATKAALDMYSRCVHAENHGVRIASIAPGVIDTAMQGVIRHSDQSSFPNVERFAQLHRDGQLASPADVAARLLRHLLSSAYGTQTIDDIRDYN